MLGNKSLNGGKEADHSVRLVTWQTDPAKTHKHRANREGREN